MRYFLFALTLFSVLPLSGCLTPQTMRSEVADRVSGAAWMIERHINASPFELTVFERMHERNAPANIYIGGDGNASRLDRVQTLNPTPENPVALHLATKDNAENIAYIARPCQYSGMLDPDAECDSAYWTNKSFAPEVIASINSAIDNIKRRYDLTDINLIGYAGGANIAAILAATRDDVKTLRTVAGNLDHAAQAAYFNAPQWPESLNAVDYADRLRNIPQHHFVGGADDRMPPAILHSYLQAIGESPCIGHTMIQEAEHERGFVEKWPQLLRTNLPECKKQDYVFEPLDIPQPIYYPRMGGDKK
ncbi:MAG: alpha/beta hydrolase [Bdellovibrionales bacterium]